MTKDGVLVLPADLGQLIDVLALTRTLLGVSFDGSFASLLGNWPFFVTQARLVTLC
jgi:hypothetical protein